MNKEGWVRVIRSVFLWGGIMFSISFMAGCGSGGDGGLPFVGPQQPVLMNGVFTGPVVSGIGYSTPTQNGLTDEEGIFLYRKGERVTFYAGEIVLGSVIGKAVVTTVDLVEGIRSSANPKAVNISRFLQLIDADGDPANGIEITEAIRELLTWNEANGVNDGSIFEDETSIFLSNGGFAVFMDSTLTSLNGGSVFTAVTPRSLSSRSATGARRNLNTALAEIAPHPFTPYVKEVGIGITDLNTSMTFYQNVLNLHFVDYRGRADRVEAIYEDNRPFDTNKIALMKFNDGSINCTNHPVKLVFAVPNADDMYAAILNGGGSGFSPPATTALGRIGMAFDPDGYLLELIEVTALTAPYLSGVGIGVSSLGPLDDFYTRVLGMKFDGTFANTVQ